jgi:lipopolysaccharide export system protein LptC
VAEARSAIDIRRRRLTTVRRLRLGLPLIAAAVLLAVGGQVVWRAVVGFTTRAAPAETGVRMVKPSFTGLGKDGSRYVVTAQSGARDAANPATINLDQPTVVIGQPGGRTSRTESKAGVFREDQMTLTMTGDVRGERSNGDRFVAQDAVINTRTGAVSGRTLRGAGTAGEIQAGDYDVVDRGDRVIMKGGVRARINPE